MSPFPKGEGDYVCRGGFAHKIIHRVLGPCLNSVLGLDTERGRSKATVLSNDA